MRLSPLAVHNAYFSCNLLRTIDCTELVDGDCYGGRAVDEFYSGKLSCTQLSTHRGATVGRTILTQRLWVPSSTGNTELRSAVRAHQSHSTSATLFGSGENLRETNQTPPALLPCLCSPGQFLYESTRLLWNNREKNGGGMFAVMHDCIRRLDGTLLLIGVSSGVRVGIKAWTITAGYFNAQAMPR